jgi:hypothetical protein
MNRTTMLLFLAAAVFAAGISLTAPAHAQATRTWVSGVGDDANPCSRTAPCKTFAGAISKTAAAGEINCLDPGGFGAVTITKSIIISCETGTAGVLVSGTNGIVVSVAATDVVYLRGLDFEGLTTGLAGISFIGSGALHVEKCLIRGFNSTSGWGIKFAPNNTASLSVADTVIADNGTSAAFTGGVLVQPTASAIVNVSLKRVQLAHNALGLDAVGDTAGSVHVVIEDSIVTDNVNSGVISETAGPRTTMMIKDSVSANNGTNGVKASGSNAALYLGNSQIYGNLTGVAVAGGATVLSYKNNQIDLNSTNGPPVTQVPLN